MYQKLFKIGQKRATTATTTYQQNIQQHTTTNLHLNLKCKLTLFDQFGAHNFQYKKKYYYRSLCKFILCDVCFTASE